MIAVVLAAVTALAAPAAPPPTIPAIRQWRPAEGAFRLTAASRIVGDRLPEAAMLARELGRPLAARPPAPGDVELALGSGDRALGAEGYRLEVGRTVRIEARTRAGVFHGTRTLLQLLRAGPAIPAGRARDWPTYPERGLMIDNGRRYFAPAWIKRRIRELAYLKLNQLHLHFSDDQGFRIESSRHPEVVSAQHLTKRQVRDIVAYARDRHVRVIGELDMPGHLRAALARHPELQLRSAEGVTRPDKLDISKPAARRFARDLILEYLDLFPGRYWHAGADEYLAPGEYADYPQLKGGRAAYLRFVRWLDRLVHAHGRTLRVWHDGLSGARLPRRVVVEWWTDHAGPPPARLLADGHRVLNAGWWPTYYVVSPLGGRAPVDGAGLRLVAGERVRRHLGRLAGAAQPAAGGAAPPRPHPRLGAARVERRPARRDEAADRARDRAEIARPGAEDLGHARAGERLRGVRAAVE